MASDKTLEQFSELMEVKAYANAQYNTILDLQSKLKASQDEILHLKSLLDGAVPANKKSNLLKGSDQEEICKRELHKLAETAKKDGQLTLEETKKVEIYTKLLLSLENKDKNKNDTLDGLTDEELLNLVQVGHGTANTK